MEPCNKRIKTDCDSDVNRFLEWCKTNFILIDFEKVKITKQNTSNNYGMIAVCNIKKDEILARIPKTILLEPNTTNIRDILDKHKDQLKSESNWTQLTLALMHESNNKSSKWSTYLDLFPDYQNLDLPHFWNEYKILKLYFINI
jgi:hypothetical protein